jgi:hypothetical protein
VRQKQQRSGTLHTSGSAFPATTAYPSIYSNIDKTITAKINDSRLIAKNDLATYSNLAERPVRRARHDTDSDPLQVVAEFGTRAVEAGINSSGAELGDNQSGHGGLGRSDARGGYGAGYQMSRYRARPSWTGD